jgi:hypothetical protein
MARARGWSHEDEELLDKLSTNDFYKIFKAAKGESLRRVIRAAQYLTSRDSAESKKSGSIAERAVKALETIAKETRLNARRVASQGVKLND